MITFFASRLKPLLAILACASVTLGPMTRDVSASHSESYVFPGAPYNGTWNLNNNAPPSSHHRPWGGHWATDYYQVQFTQGILWLATNRGTPVAIMSDRTNSCSNPNDYAGEAYRFDPYNAGGNRGFIEYAHVSNWDPVYYQEYPISEQQQLGSGALVGWVAYWGLGSGVPAGVDPEDQCYAVYTDSGNHWHAEMGQSIGAGHYSCYYNYPSSYPLYGQDWLGIAGANSTSYPTTC